MIFISHGAFSSSKINVKDYGAKGDGKTDDTQAIQSAINAANPLINTTIYFPAGIYNIAHYTTTSNYLENYSLLLRSNINIVGDGQTTVIRVANHIFDKIDTSANAHLFYGKKVNKITFSKLLIDMNGANNLVPEKVIKNHAAIFTSYGSNYYIHDIVIKNCSGTNMLNIMSKGSNLKIENCKFLNGGNYVGISKPNKFQYDFSFIYSEWDSTVVRNNVIEQQDIDEGLGNYTGGVELHGSFSSASFNTITGCWPAIYITSSMGNVMKDVAVTNNNFINCVTGISFWLIQPMENITIDSNVIKLTHSRSPKLNLCAGIYIPNGNAKEYNKRLANAASIRNLEIEDNVISADTMQNLSVGLVVHSLQKSNIQNNTISEMNYGGIYLSGSKWGTNSLLITGNTFTNFRPNNDKNAVGGYIIITDSYSKGINGAPGFKSIILTKNNFLRNNNSKAGMAAAIGKFFGVFIAIPSNMIPNIAFSNNHFSDPSEKIQTVKID